MVETKVRLATLCSESTELTYLPRLESTALVVSVELYIIEV